MTHIDRLPAEVNQRRVPSHWAGDLLKVAMNRSAVGTLVERTTLFCRPCQAPQPACGSCRQGLQHYPEPRPKPMRLSLTYDQVREMARHQWLAPQIGMDVYFAHPHSPRERGLCGNANGLLRQYLPRGTDLSLFSQEQLDQIAMQLNARPRNLGWQAPAGLFLPEGEFNFVESYFQIDTINPVALGA